MTDSLYFFSTFFAGVIGIVLAALLAGLQIRKSEGLQKYNRARWCLVGAFSVFGIMNLVEVSLNSASEDDGGNLTACLAIVVGSLMAMFFTMTVLSFIRPQIVHRKQILAQLAAIVPPCILLILTMIYAPEPVFRVVFRVILAGYLLLMVLYTRLFVRCYRGFREQMLAFYEEEDLVDQLHWTNWTFWLALATGIASLLYLADSPQMGTLLNVIFSVCFVLIHIFFVNYRPYAQLVDRAVSEQPAVCAVPGGVSNRLEDSELRGKVDAWIQQKGYLDNTKSVDDIAADMKLYYPSLKEYIHRTTGEDFRSWRIRLRVEEAERILAASPDLPVSQVATMAGFNDRAYFYRSFQKISGQSVREYLDALA